MQTIMTPAGETLVVLPLAEYEALIDQRDIADADKVRVDIAAGRDELIPAEFTNALLGGENPVRVYRSYRKISARDLAKKVGISTSYLSEIETGKKEGRITVLRNIADALNVSLDDLV